MAEIDNKPPAPFGRVRLDRVCAGWSNHPFKVQLLASEVADTLRTLSPPNHPVDSFKVCRYVERRPERENHLTFDSLADYFDAVRPGKQPTTIQAKNGPVEASSVLIWQGWIDQVTDLAVRRAAVALGLAQPLNDSGEIAWSVNGQPSFASPVMPATLPIDSLTVLRSEQAQTRRDGERTSSSKLDEERSRRERAEQQVAELKAQLAIEQARAQHSIDEAEQYRREVSSERRARLEAMDEAIRLEERLEQVMGLAEFMNEDNPLSPPEGRLIVQCWRDVTRDGVDPPGVGWNNTVRRWFKAKGLSPKEITVKLFAKALTGSARKKGGAIAANRDKG